MIRPFNVEDYDLLCSWWTGHGWDVPVPLAALPTHGLIANECAAGFLYRTDSDLCWITWMVADPKRPQDSASALRSVIDGLVTLAKELGYTTAITSIQHSGLIALFQRAGFDKTETSMTNLTRSL